MTSVRSTVAIEITPEIKAAADSCGARYHVSSALHECDHVLGYIVEHSQQSKRFGPVGGTTEYFDNGKKDADQIVALMKRSGMSMGGKILEFASGFGRVSRHLTGYNLTCSDIHEDAIKFLTDGIGVRAFLSSLDPSDIRAPDRFDFIFVLSLFSHLPDHLFARWLVTLVEMLNPGGFLMFTTHGEYAGRKVPVLAECLDAKRGYGFLHTSDQRDLSSSVYGSSIVTPAYVVPRMYDLTSCQLEFFMPGAWWDLQDEWVFSNRGPRSK